MEIKVSEEIKKACPQFAGIAIRATVKNTAYSESLWKKIDEFTVRYREMYTTDSIKDMVTIHATREAYKKCGKDPSRYRPSGEGASPEGQPNTVSQDREGKTATENTGRCTQHTQLS